MSKQRRYDRKLRPAQPTTCAPCCCGSLPVSYTMTLSGNPKSAAMRDVQDEFVSDGCPPQGWTKVSPTAQELPGAAGNPMMN